MTAIEFNHKIVSFHDQLKYFAGTLAYSSADAEDLVQDTYIKAISNKDKFRDDVNIRAWLFTIMKNTFINNYRRARKTNTIVDTTNDLYYMNITNSSKDSIPDTIVAEKEIETEINNLSDDQRIPFEMHHQGFKYKEIAEELDLSIGTVKSRIFFGRKKLMEQLKDFAN